MNLTNMNEIYGRLQKTRYIDEPFMLVAFRDKTVMQYILRCILDKDDFVVKSVVPHFDTTRKIGCAVYFDIFAVDSQGMKYDIKFQKQFNDVNPFGARFDSARMDANSFKSCFNKNLIESYVIFIKETDIFQQGKPLYHIERTVAECNNQSFRDGSHIIYVNGEYRAADTLGLLMADLFAENADDIHSPLLAEKMRYLKQNEKGIAEIYQTLKQIGQDYIEQGRLENIREIVNFMQKAGHTVEEISHIIGVPIADIEKAKKSLLNQS